MATATLATLMGWLRHLSRPRSSVPTLGHPEENEARQGRGGRAGGCGRGRGGRRREVFALRSLFASLIRRAKVGELFGLRVTSYRVAMADAGFRRPTLLSLRLRSDEDVVEAVGGALERDAEHRDPRFAGPWHRRGVSRRRQK